MFSLLGLAILRQEPTGDAAWNQGYRDALRGWSPHYGSDYCNEDKSQYRDGWQAGDAERRAEGMEPTEEDIAEYHGDDADGWIDSLGELHPYPCEGDDFDLAMPNDEYYALLAESDEPDEWTMEEWNRDRGIIRGRCVDGYHDVEQVRMGRAG